MEGDTGQLNVDHDDWNSFPTSKNPNRYKLSGYCKMSGKPKFRKLPPIMEEEETYNITSVEEDTDTDVFEEDILEEENQVFSTTSVLEDKQPSQKDFDRLDSGSIAASRTLKDLNILTDYIRSEGAIPNVRAKCGDCIQRNCKSCYKMERMSPKEATVLEELRGNIEEEILPDKTIRFSFKYATCKPLENTFPSHLSNYEDAFNQAKS